MTSSRFLEQNPLSAAVSKPEMPPNSLSNPLSKALVALLPPKMTIKSIKSARDLLEAPAEHQPPALPGQAHLRRGRGAHPRPLEDLELHPPTGAGGPGEPWTHAASGASRRREHHKKSMRNPGEIGDESRYFVGFSWIFMFFHVFLNESSWYLSYVWL